tara:strand:+ start:1991 stop:2233 length:243 start_codon:yes stop_codon:yes gene_type:complete
MGSLGAIPKGTIEVTHTRKESEIMSQTQRTMQRDERDDKIAELEAMIDKADAMYAEKVYELQQLQKSLTRSALRIPQIQS